MVNDTLLCRECSISRFLPKAPALAANLEGTVMGPVLEVHIVKIIDGYGIEVAIPSIAKRFVNEIHYSRISKK